MKPERILQLVDNNITKMLIDQNFDQIRSKLFYTSKKFKERIKDYNPSQLSGIKDSRTKYSAYYVYFCEKRIADLIKIEVSKFQLSDSQKFKLLIFKEKLVNGNTKINFSKKYLNLINKK